MQLLSLEQGAPHQTGVTERSIGGNDWLSADRVMNDVVIPHQPNWICDCFAVDVHCKHHIGWLYIGRISGARKRWIWQRMKHPFKMILPREPCANCNQCDRK